MIEAAIRLLATKGLQGASFSEVLDASGAPRGSVYHHFPGGKDELVKAALEHVSQRSLAALEARAGAPAKEIAVLFLAGWRELLSRSKQRAGCSVLAVSVAADSPELLDAAGAVFRTWRLALARLLAEGGLAPKDAERFAAMLIASSEGAVVLARAERSLEPFELVATQLLEQVARLSR